MVDALSIDEHLAIPLVEISLSASRASGPGGQHVNKTETRIQLRWNPARSVALNDRQRRLVLNRLAGRLTADGDLLLACGNYRSQLRNRQACLARLARLIRTALSPPPVRKPTQPSAASREKRLAQKRRRSEQKKRRRPPTEED
jgi:ribosome-associated protein